MRHPTWGFLLPIAEIGTIVWMVRRIHYKRYPMLLAYLATDAVANILVLSFKDWWVQIWTFASPIRMLMRGLMVLEIMRISCVDLDRRARILIASSTISSCGVAVMLAKKISGLSPLQSFYVFGQFYHLVLAVALVVLCVRRHMAPIMENADHRTYRNVMTANMIKIFLNSTVVKGGWGYLMLPWNDLAWSYVDKTMWVVSMVLTATLCYGMTASISTLRPEVAFPEIFRKKAAK